MLKFIKMTSLLSKIISSSVAVADHAGIIIRDIMAKGELGIVAKEHAKDLQTEADRSAQKFIVGSLSTFFPKMKIIGEEEDDGTEYMQNLLSASDVNALPLKCPPNYDNLKEEEIVMWVDPLDGTAEYTQASECLTTNHSGICKDASPLTCSSLLDHVTVLIGIATLGKVIAGVIHQPYYNYKNPGEKLGRTIWAVVGGEIGGIKIVQPPQEGCIITTTRSHSSSTVNDAITSLNPSEILRVGGAGHKVLLLIEGKAHAYVFASPGCKKWDTAAPQALLEAAGGKLTDINGNPIPYDSKAVLRNATGVLAVAPGLVHGDFLVKIPQHVKDNLKA